MCDVKMESEPEFLWRILPFLQQAVALDELSDTCSKMKLSAEELKRPGAWRNISDENAHKSFEVISITIIMTSLIRKLNVLRFNSLPKMWRHHPFF